MDVRKICYGRRQPASSLALDLSALSSSQNAEARLPQLLKGHIHPQSQGKRCIGLSRPEVALLYRAIAWNMRSRLHWSLAIAPGR